jgi:hypothetical protein
LEREKEFVKMMELRFEEAEMILGVVVGDENGVEVVEERRKMLVEELEKHKEEDSENKELYEEK